MVYFKHMDFPQKIAEIKNTVKTICAEAGTDADKVIIVAAVKTRSADDVCRLKGLINDIGENRVQEFNEHYLEVVCGAETFKWHFIGRLQTNKVKYLIEKDVLIHSLDREELAAEINRLSLKHGVITECLAEINIADEPSKGGILFDDTENFLKSLENYQNIKIKGIMSVLPAITPEEGLDEYYIKLGGLYERIKKLSIKNLDCKYLSAGMSNDYRTALKYGANIIRLGTSIFGPRDYTL
ncbi:MAG: YggS family pyridoxal phosphate-dependent enzyme [Clostridiales bacterium]|nr:YggS family pyridoxal phosphate-dependent enzyme [Clostridiales bacterium]